MTSDEQRKSDEVMEVRSAAELAELSSAHSTQPGVTGTESVHFLHAVLDTRLCAAGAPLFRAAVFVPDCSPVLRGRKAILIHFYQMTARMQSILESTPSTHLDEENR